MLYDQEKKNPWTHYEVVRRFYLIVAATGFGQIQGDRSTTACWHAGWPHSRFCESNTFYMLVDEEESQSQLYSESFGIPLLLPAPLWACFSTPALPTKGLKLENSGYCSLQEWKMMTKLLLLVVKGHRSHQTAIVSFSYIWSDFTVLCMQFETQWESHLLSRSWLFFFSFFSTLQQFIGL